MKVTVCDVCASEGTLREADFNTGIKGVPRSHVCKEHKEHFDGMDKMTYLKESLKLDENYYAQRDKVK